MEAKAGGYEYTATGGSALSKGAKAVKGAVKGASSVVRGVAGRGNKAVNKVVSGVIGGKLTAQGTVALVCYGIMLVAAAFSPVVAAQMELTHAGIAALVAVLISAALSIYGINCMVTGGCHRLSWLYVAMLLIWTFGVVGGTAFAKYGGKAPSTHKPDAEMTRLLPEPKADVPAANLLPGPAMQHPGAPTPATAAEVAEGTNRIVNTQRANLYEGYDAQGNEDQAPMPYVEGEHASA
jgi:hypothetical protein